MLVFSAGVTITTPAAAQTTESPFEDNLLRLSEILGSLHFLRNLCGEKGGRWRGEMGTLLAIENPDPERKARLVARFNRGYRAFAGNYTVCTAAAVEATGRYIKEGEQLSRETAVRYGN
ncbi:TIGR02301 family protein [Mesorhizobium sp. LHD-90]|uniref:TIGR02301 family protein n=1 Tax=Mesorhizobium sp. LHD-90 TaxID=3071414 RepID=UPI0027DF96C8|nr:TIGR02301 family protein [Mesorhizobium sp. LHD-90]MDQ6437990.1 TIGR02301 family protein [Mesorhizobium sp. LHD-90]